MRILGFPTLQSMITKASGDVTFTVGGRAIGIAGGKTAIKVFSSAS